MTLESDDRLLEEAIGRVIGSDDVRFDEADWKRKHLDEMVLIESWKRNDAAARTIGERWIRRTRIRTILHNRATRIAVPAAAAAVVIAVAVILSTGGGPAANVFADCLQQLRTTSYEFDMEIKPTGGTSNTWKGMVREPGRLRLDQRGENETFSTLFNHATKQWLILFHRQKVAQRLDRQKEHEAGFARFLSLLCRSVEEIWKQKAGNEKRLGEKQIDGKPAVGFRVTTKDDWGSQTIDVWAEAKTGRPLKIDTVLQSGGQDRSLLKVSMKNFKPVDNLYPDLFDMAVPEGYTLANHTTLEQLTAPRDTGLRPPPAATSGEAKNILESIALCAAGKKQQAVHLLMTVDFNGDIRFGPEHFLFSMTERQYVSLVTDDKRKAFDQIKSQMTQFRGVTRELLALARTARESGQLAAAEGYFTTALSLGRLLSRNADGTIVARGLGMAYETTGLEGLSAIYQETNQPEQLAAVREQLKQVEGLRNQLRNTTGAQRVPGKPVRQPE